MGEAKRLERVTSEAGLREMLAESAGLYGSGVLTFRVLGAGFGLDVYLAAHHGNETAQNLLSVATTLVEEAVSAPPGSVPCLICGDPFVVAEDRAWAVLVVHAAVDTPTMASCHGLCTVCCETMDAGELQRRINAVFRTVFPTFDTLQISQEVGHA